MTKAKDRPDSGRNTVATMPGARPIKAVLFDFDGTLTQPGALDMAALKPQIGCPTDVYLLEYIDSLPAASDKKQALATLDAFEMQAARKARPNGGAEALIGFLKSQRLPVGIISRNSRRSIERSLANFGHLTRADFDLVISRDDPPKPKPSPEGPRYAAAAMGVDPAEALLVGDFILDVQAGRRAGMQTALLLPPGSADADPLEPDFTIGHLEEVKNIILFGTPLAPGKLPNRFLDEFLDQFAIEDGSVLIQPGVGDDTAAVDIAGAEVLVLKSDPITFATDAIGNYAVLVNANDIATAGATPRWFLTTLLFPVGASTVDIRQVMQQLSEVSRHWGVTLCGGHTEVTDAVTRPVVVGMMAGTVAAADLVDKRNMRPGDGVLLTKGVAVEGTAIIAREFGDRLAQAGMSSADIETCRHFLTSISILPEAATAARANGVSAMHDVTEGGLATALDELSVAGGHRIRIYSDRIPIYPETQTLCRLFDLNPLGLIGSGSLLICCRPEACRSIIDAIETDGIQVTRIGEVIEPGMGVQAERNRRPAPWPTFEVDEITRLFS